MSETAVINLLAGRKTQPDVPNVRTDTVTLSETDVELLLICARTEVSPSEAARIRYLTGLSVDWDKLVVYAHQLGVLPLFLRTLNAVVPGALPGEMASNLSRSSKVGLLFNTFRAKELLRLLAIFRSHGIVAIPFKGPTLANWLYGDLNVREFGDLDILVRRDRFEDALALLEQEGYRAQERMEDSDGHSINLINPVKAIFLDLHYQIVSDHIPFSPNEEELWANLHPVQVCGEKVLTFSPEHMLWFLCVHGSKHCWARLIWIVDVAELIQAHPDLDWSSLLGRISSSADARMLLLGPLLAKQLLGTRLPEGVLARIHADPVLRKAARTVRDRMVSGYSYKRGNSLARYRFLIGIVDGVPARLRLFRHALGWALTPSEKDRQMVRLPGKLSFFYYLLRPFRLTYESIAGKKTTDSSNIQATR